MSTKNDEPAFPVQNCAEWQYHGMTLRDYFAAKAMASMLHFEFEKDGFATMATVSKDAYRMADALLEARKS